MIKAVIFDFDGTLMNTLPGIAYFGNSALAEAGLPPIDEEKYKYFVGNGRDKLIHRMLEFYGADTAENFEKVGKKYDCLYEADASCKSVVYDGIYELLDKLCGAGIKTAVLSNKPDNVIQMLAAENFEGKFDVCLGRRAEMPHKPDPRSALEIAEAVGAAAEECLFVGDTCVDISTGKNAGMYTAGVLWGFRDVSEFSEADFIVGNAAEIFDAVKKIK